MTCKDCMQTIQSSSPEEVEGIENHCEEFKDKASFVELKNMKWKPHYYIFNATGEKIPNGWHCSVCSKRSVCSKHSYSRKEICDGCNTTMWKVEIR